jgi:hypothetical protein
MTFWWLNAVLGTLYGASVTVDVRGVEQVFAARLEEVCMVSCAGDCITVANESDGVHRRPLAKGAEGLLT